MVLRGHHHVFHSGSARELCPRSRCVWLGLELVSVWLVFLRRDSFVFHHPLVTTKRAVEAPVNEHAKLRFMPPLHPAGAIRNSRGGRRTGINGPRLLRRDKLELRSSGNTASRSAHNGKVVSSIHLHVSLVELDSNDEHTSS